MNLRDIFGPLFKWWWLIAVATFVAGVSSFVAVMPKPEIYQASTTLYVGRTLNDPNPSNNEIGVSRDLAEAYTDIANREPVRAAAAQALGLTSLPPYEAQMISDHPLIQIVVTDINPERAQAVANELAHQLILKNPTNSTMQDPARTDFINNQLAGLQAQIQKVEDEINQKQDSLKTMNSAAQIADMQSQIDTLSTKLNILVTNYTTLLQSTQQGAMNTLSVIEPASLPTKPIGPNKPAIILLVTLVGLGLSAAVTHLLEYLDQSIKTPEDVKKIFDLPVIGFIEEIHNEKEEYFFVAEHPLSPIAEAFRSLRTNIEFSAVDKPIRTLLITSPDISEGKTTIATNLALMMAQSDKKVVLMDADLRRPSIHLALKMPVNPGLSEVFRDKVDLFDALRAWRDKQVLLLTSGTLPPNPAELLASKKMDRLIARMSELVDTVIIDGPPFLVTDAAVLSSKVDAVLLVIRPGVTRQDVAKDVQEQLVRSGARVIGVVFNRVPKQGMGYLESHQHKSKNYSSLAEGSDIVSAPARKSFLSRFRRDKDAPPATQ